MNRVYLLLGSNLGDRAAIISKASALLSMRLLPELSAIRNNIEDEVKNAGGDIEVSEKQAMDIILPMFVMSDILETEPLGFESDNKFLNMAVSCKTLYRPEDVLKICQNIEKELGRDRVKEGPAYDEEGNRIYYSRIIDIDILFFESLKIEISHRSDAEVCATEGACRELMSSYKIVKVDTPDLQIPHPMLPQRLFAQQLLINVIDKENTVR